MEVFEFVFDLGTLKRTKLDFRFGKILGDVMWNGKFRSGGGDGFQLKSGGFWGG